MQHVGFSPTRQAFVACAECGANTRGVGGESREGRAASCYVRITRETRRLDDSVEIAEQGTGDVIL